MFVNSMKLAAIALSAVVYGQSCSIGGDPSVVALSGEPVGTETVVNGGTLLKSSCLSCKAKMWTATDLVL